MATQITIKFFPGEMAKCLDGATDMVKSEAEKIAQQAAQNGPAGATYTVEVRNVARFQDSSYGVTRPVAYARVVGNSVASADEAENKTMSKAVTG